MSWYIYLVFFKYVCHSPCTSQLSYIIISFKDGSAELGDYKIKEFALMADMLVSEGQQGKVIRH